MRHFVRRRQNYRPLPALHAVHACVHIKVNRAVVVHALRAAVFALGVCLALVEHDVHARSRQRLREGLLGVAHAVYRFLAWGFELATVGLAAVVGHLALLDLALALAGALRRRFPLIRELAPCLHQRVELGVAQHPEGRFAETARLLKCCFGLRAVEVHRSVRRLHVCCYVLPRHIRRVHCRLRVPVIAGYLVKQPARLLGELLHVVGLYLPDGTLAVLRDLDARHAVLEADDLSALVADLHVSPLLLCGHGVGAAYTVFAGCNDACADIPCPLVRALILAAVMPAQLRRGLHAHVADVHLGEHALCRLAVLDQTALLLRDLRDADVRRLCLLLHRLPHNGFRER